MPLNQHVKVRLAACLAQLRAAHAGSNSMSSSSRGHEREAFVELFLKNVLPPAFRFGTGDLTDTTGNRSGQIDLVIEHNMVPSFPLVGTAGPRLYLAEGVAAAIEVKSDLTRQWDEALATAEKVTKLNSLNGYNVPFFIVGYKGWADLETLEKKATKAGDSGVALTGVLSIEPAFFVGGRYFPEAVEPKPMHGFPHVLLTQPHRHVLKTVLAEDEAALFSMLAILHDCTNQLYIGKNTLLDYMSFVPLAEKS